jgi:hypothetical protein
VIEIQDAIDAPLSALKTMQNQATSPILSSLNELESWIGVSASSISNPCGFSEYGIHSRPMSRVQQGAFFEIPMQGK